MTVRSEPNDKCDRVQTEMTIAVGTWGSTEAVQPAGWLR